MPYVWRDTMASGGTIVVGFGESRQVEIEAQDPFGNAAVLRFTVTGDTAVGMPRTMPYSLVVQSDQETVYDLGDARLIIPRGAVYATTYLPASIRTATVSGAYSSCYDVGNDQEPLQRAVEVTVPLTAVPAALRAKAYLGRCTGSRRARAMPSEVSADGQYLIGQLSDWTSFAVYVDTVPPTVRAQSATVFGLEDDVSTARHLSYRVTQGGRWVLASYDAKRARLEVRRDLLDGSPLRVEVWDQAGNRTVYPRPSLDTSK